MSPAPRVAVLSRMRRNDSLGHLERAIPDDASARLFWSIHRRRIDFLLLSNEGGLVIAWIGLALAVLLIVFWSLTHSSS
jgi:hypothetical protein